MFKNKTKWLINSLALIIMAIAFTGYGKLNNTKQDYLSSFGAVKYNISKQSYNKNMKLDAKKSLEIFDIFMKKYDANKMFFTKEIIDKYIFKEYIHELKEDQIIIAFGDIIDDFENQVEKQYNYAINLLKEYKFDFNTNDEYVYDREKAKYFANEKELNSYWYKKVLNDVERLVLAKKEKQEIQNILEKRYKANMKNILKMSDEEKVASIINAYAEVFDPHNAWYGKDASKEFEIDSSLNLIGMGAQIQQRGETNVITKLLAGGPAEKSKKFFAGDQFVYVGEGENGELVDVSSYRLKDLVKLVRGKEGSVVRIGVRRNENEPVRIIRLVREKIKQEDEQISSKLIEYKEKKVGYIKIPGFYSKSFEGEGRNVSEDLLKELEDFNNKKYDSLVIDLRNNGGGSLSEVIKMIGYFVGPNKVVVQVKDESDKIYEYKTNTNLIWEKPVVVMINRSSASASEIFAGAIKDYRRGVVVGNTTWGKGSVQRVLPLMYTYKGKDYDFGLFKYTINMFFRPNGSSTQIKGVSPDIEFLVRSYDKEYGEFKYKNALKWEKIKNEVDSKFKLNKTIDELKKLHNDRIKNDLKYALIIEQNDFSEKYFNLKKTTLNLKQREKEREEKASKQKYFKEKAKKLNIPTETVFVLDNGLSYNEENIEEQNKREEILKKYIDPETYEAAYISLDLID